MKLNSVNTEKLDFKQRIFRPRSLVLNLGVNCRDSESFLCKPSGDDILSIVAAKRNIENR